MLRTFFVIAILSLLIISNCNLYEAKWLYHQNLMVNIGKMKTCSIECDATQTCRIKCLPTLTTTTTTTTATTTKTSTTTTITSTDRTSTTMASITTNIKPAKADHIENQKVILIFFFQNEMLFY